MATTNHERVGKALELLKRGLGPFVEREISSTYQERAATELGRFIGDDRLNARKPVKEWDVGVLLKFMWDACLATLSPSRTAPWCGPCGGEVAWQLGDRKAFARVQADDEKATSPGDVLRELFIEYGPCLVLIDEWVAYARQLHDQSDLPAGGFENQFSFAQVLTESAKLANRCLLVISLPASDTAGSPTPSPTMWKWAGNGGAKPSTG